MKYEVKRSPRFNKEYELAERRGLDIRALDEVIYKLANGYKLEAKHKDHALHGKFQGYRECHVMSDWLLIYKIFDDKLELLLFRTGSHSDLF